MSYKCLVGISFLFLLQQFVCLKPVAYDETNIHQLIKSFLPEDAVFIEAGAHHGEDTCILASLFPYGRIYAFEPYAPSFSVLKKVVVDLKNVTCYSFALGDKTGKTSLYLRPGNDGANSILQPALEAPKFDPNPIEIDVVELDRWAKTYNILRVDGMWLDMEGAELKALKAASHILKMVKVIYTEINYQEFRKDNANYYELRGWLEKQGFTEVWKSVAVICPQKQARYAKINKSLVPWQGNALFVRF